MPIFFGLLWRLLKVCLARHRGLHVAQCLVFGRSAISSRREATKHTNEPVPVHFVGGSLLLDYVAWRFVGRRNTQQTFRRQFRDLRCLRGDRLSLTTLLQSQNRYLVSHHTRRRQGKTWRLSISVFCLWLLFRCTACRFRHCDGTPDIMMTCCLCSISGYRAFVSYRKHSRQQLL